MSIKIMQTIQGNVKGGDPVCDVCIGKTKLKFTVDSESLGTIITDKIYYSEWSSIQLLPLDIRTITFGSLNGFLR